MNRLAVAFLCGFFSGAPLVAQVEQLATSGDGGVLLFHTRFRLQTETDLGLQGEIYRWQEGEWTRLVTARDIGFAVSPPDVFSPFLSMDGAVVGWQINVGCSLCQIIVVPPLSSEISGVSLPPTFPRGTLRMSANGRYYTADSYPFSGAKYLDAATGEVAEVPVDLFARPVVREVSNDGTVLLSITQPKDLEQFNAPGTLSLWKPGSDPRPVYSENRVFSPTISANGGRVAFEAVVEDGPDDDQRTLLVLDTQTGERLPVASMPPRDYRATRESFSKPVWDADGTRLIYRTFDDREQPVAISLWEAGTRASRVILTSSEGFSSAVISGDGRMIWAVTSTNRLLRLDLFTGLTDEILPPLGSVAGDADGPGVPGSAVLIRGVGVTRTQMALDGDVQLPLVDAAPEGLWVQIPWEYASFSQGTHKVLIRSQNNPFEAVVNVGITPGIEPYLATWEDPATGNQYAKAVHQDFQSLVTPASPARAGETVHVYLTGLGPLDQALPTGAPGPLAPLAHPVAPLNCRLGSSPSQPLLMPYVGYAVGMIGIYQADLTIPDDAPQGIPMLYCAASDASGIVHTTARPLSTISAP
jgi:uncharacterized protein (TIGR03437 family)